MSETWCYGHFLCLFASSRLIALCIPQLLVALDKSIRKMTKCKCKHEQKQGCNKLSIVYFVSKSSFLVSSDYRSRSCVKYHYSVWQLNILSFFLNERRGFSLELAVMRCCLMFFEAHIISAVFQLCLWSLESLWPLKLSSLGRCQHTVRPLPSRFVTSQVNWNILIISLVV